LLETAGKPAASNILNQAFRVEQPDRVWAGDMTFIHTRKGVLHLVVLIDLYSRQVVGWSISNKQDRYLVKDALRMAIEAREPKLQITNTQSISSKGPAPFDPLILRKSGCHSCSAPFTTGL